MKRLVVHVLIFLVAFSAVSLAQPSNGDGKETPRVIRVDEVSVQPILKPAGKPRLVNFWATWCVPCVEEFPLLVELHAKYKDRIDLITISLDDPIEATRDVPRFLKEQKATMPAYLLYTQDENAVISSISKDLSGGLPLTVLYSKEGQVIYTQEGLIKREVIVPKIESALEIKECEPKEF